MNTFFNIDRFWKLAKRNIFLSRMQYIYITIGLIGLYLLSILLYILVETPLNGLIFLAAASTIMISPCFMEEKINKDISIFDFILPASTFEKYFWMWTKHVIIFPLLIFAIIFILNLISNIIPNESINEHAAKMSLSHICKSKILVIIIEIQAVFMAGYFSFKKHAFAKTFLTILLYLVICIFIGILIGHVALKGGNVSFNLSANTPHETAFSIGYATGKIIGLDIFNNSTISILDKIISIVLIGGLWIVSFFKLREKEI